MKEVGINGRPRLQTGKKDAARLRKEGFVPCVMYGGKEVVHFYAHELELRKIIYTANAYLVNLDLEGKQHSALLKDIQFHPVTDKVIHVDFVEAMKDKEVIVDIPIHLTGDSVGIKAGGKLRQRRRHLKVKGLPEDFPEYLQIDISNLDVGNKIRIGDLTYDGLTLVDTHRALVVQVISSRLAAKGMTIAEEAPEAAPAEAEEAGAEAETPETGEEES